MLCGCYTRLRHTQTVSSEAAFPFKDILERVDTTLWLLASVFPPHDVHEQHYAAAAAHIYEHKYCRSSNKHIPLLVLKMHEVLASHLDSGAKEGRQCRLGWDKTTAKRKTTISGVSLKSSEGDEMKLGSD